MKRALSILQMLIRVIGATMLVLGVLFWTGNAYSLINLHMLLGLLLVAMLWAVAGLAARAGVHIGLVALGFAWGLVVPILGLNQASLLPGPMHWLIQILHLLVGLGAIGIAETLSRRAAVRLAQSPASVAGRERSPTSSIT
jgi:hypothetical protein